MESRFLIYDLPVEVVIADIYSRGIKKFKEQFDIYPRTDKKPVIKISISDKESEKKILNNPSIHFLTKTGFLCKYPKYNQSFAVEDGLLKINIRLQNQGNRVVSYLKKLNNNQYDSLEERLVQIVWENCFYYGIYFQPNYALIHSSGFVINKEEALLLGGTGGVGKTSLELKLAENKSFGFLNDDIAVINREGVVFPNMSWPKIYAYNLVNNQKIKSLIFKNRSFDDKFAWSFKKHIFGISKVRRTLSPFQLFKQNSLEAVPLKKYVLLSRGDYQKLNLRPFDKSLIPEINTTIMKGEFADFEQHINWHNYNSKLNGTTPIIDLKQIHSNWNDIHKKVLENVHCYILEIPQKIDHTTFMNDASQLILELYKGRV